MVLENLSFNCWSWEAAGKCQRLVTSYAFWLLLRVTPELQTSHGLVFLFLWSKQNEVWCRWCSLGSGVLWAGLPCPGIPACWVLQWTETDVLLQVAEWVLELTCLHGRERRWGVRNQLNRSAGGDSHSELSLKIQSAHWKCSKKVTEVCHQHEALDNPTRDSFAC